MLLACLSHLYNIGKLIRMWFHDHFRAICDPVKDDIVQQSGLVRTILDTEIGRFIPFVGTSITISGAVVVVHVGLLN